MKTILSAEKIQARVGELAIRIGEDYAGKPLTIVGILTGSLVLLADLTRRLPIPHRLAVIQASSYRGATTSPGELHVNTELIPDLQGRHVILLDDILDTGATLSSLVKQVQQLGPLSVRTCVLLRKIGRQTVSVEPEYLGFKIPNVFVVGYGLDYNDDYRHLPFVAGMEPEDLAREGGESRGTGAVCASSPTPPASPRPSEGT